MINLIAYFRSDPTKFVRVEDMNGSIEEITKTYSDAFQNSGCKALVFLGKSGVHIINKDAVAMIELVVEEDDD